MADPVSWFLIEPGWDVVDSTGKELGRVHQVLGDPDADIFDGLEVETGILGKPQYVPAEQVGTIVEGRVQMEQTAAELGFD